MIGTIELENLRVQCIVGVLPREREHEQDLFFDVVLELDLAEASRSDELSKTVDYTAVASLLTELATQGRFKLLETLAERAAERVLETQPRVRRVRLAVKKPGALQRASNTVVRVERSR